MHGARLNRAIAAALGLAALGQAPLARAQEAQVSSDASADGQELSGALGAEMGGRVSPGGLHVAGAYLYQLSEQDWFDGALSFTFGGGDAACFRDRDGDTLCEHGVLDGFGGEIAAGVRRYFAGRGQVVPYARAAVGLRVVSYSADDVAGLAIPLSAGGGVRWRASERVWIAGGAELRIGPAWFNSDLGSEPQLGLAIHAAAEVSL